jgi:hypothetical protein
MLYVPHPAVQSQFIAAVYCFKQSVQPAAGVVDGGGNGTPTSGQILHKVDITSDSIVSELLLGCWLALAIDQPQVPVLAANRMYRELLVKRTAPALLSTVCHCWCNTAWQWHCHTLLGLNTTDLTHPPAAG